MTATATGRSVPPDSAPPLEKGRRIGDRYEVEGPLGEGATGTVYAATRVDDGARVALKVIHRHLAGDRQVQGRAQREAAILSRLEGPHVVKLLDSLQDDDRLVLVLEYVDAESLERLLAREGPLDIPRAVEITLQVCAALGVAHAAGVVHRDLKPANVLLARNEGVLDVRVVDFGLARMLHGGHGTTGLTEQGMIFGTPEYMAPEQARGDEADVRADIYAAGVMLYEMCTGKPPFSARSPIATMTAHLTEEPKPPRSARPETIMSAAVETVILRALAKNPGDRFESARTFAEALSAARREREIVAAPPSHPGSITDTELSLSTSQLSHSPTVPSEIPVVAAPPVSTPSVSRRTTRERLLWTVVAVVAVLAGIAIGILIGVH